MVKIGFDSTDGKILHQLDLNSRMPVSIIARKLRLSREVVNYRVNKFVENKVIKKFHTIIDISKLGYAVHKVFIRFQNMTEQKETGLLNFIEKNQNIVYSASYDGKFDIVISFWARNVEELADNFREFEGKFGKFIAEKQIATITKGEYNVRNYLVDIKSARRESLFGSVPEKMKLDEINKNILFELGKNARISSVEISGKIKMSADAVSKRIKDLEKSGIIQGYNIVPNEENYPYSHYKILISMREFAPEKEKKFINYLKLHKNIWYFCSCLGNWDYEVDLDAENEKEFREFLRQLKINFSDIIKDYTVMKVYRTNKYNFCPSIPERKD
jgi:Lrp/AsnC family leucine-responsive transcriptional regulator